MIAFAVPNFLCFITTPGALGCCFFRQSCAVAPPAAVDQPRLRCAAYCRSSSPQGSLVEQLNTCREAARAHGWELRREFEFTDQASGMAAARPGLEGLLQATAAGGLHVVIVPTIDRLARDRTDLAELLRKLIGEYGVKVVALG